MNRSAAPRRHQEIAHVGHERLGMRITATKRPIGMCWRYVNVGIAGTIIAPMSQSPHLRRRDDPSATQTGQCKRF